MSPEKHPGRRLDDTSADFSEPTSSSSEKVLYDRSFTRCAVTQSVWSSGTADHISGHAGIQGSSGYRRRWIPQRSRRPVLRLHSRDPAQALSRPSPTDPFLAVCVRYTPANGVCAATTAWVPTSRRFAGAGRFLADVHMTPAQMSSVRKAQPSRRRFVHPGRSRPADTVIHPGRSRLSGSLAHHPRNT
jgi:hypothetical protein